MKFIDVEIFVEQVSMSTPRPDGWGFYDPGTSRQSSLAVEFTDRGSGAGRHSL